MQPSPDAAEPRLFSVGHSTHELAAFLQLLRQAGVTAVADVRTHPFSQRLPQYNKPDLERALKAAGIEYVFLGELLGGRPEEPDLYDDEGHVDYEKVRMTSAFRRGLERLLAGLGRYRIAMMCAEADPLDCHRGLMIAPAAVERGVQPSHIRRDGSVETTCEMERRLLLVETDVGRGVFDGLFADQVTAEVRAEYLTEAYRQQARRKGYRRRPDVG